MEKEMKGHERRLGRKQPKTGVSPALTGTGTQLSTLLGKQEKFERVRPSESKDKTNPSSAIGSTSEGSED